MIIFSRIRRQAALFLSLAATLALLMGYTLQRATFADRPAARSLAPAGKWIRTPGDLDYQGYFRKTVFLNSYPKQAWLRVAAEDSFEVIVNGNSINELPLWRPTRQFQTGLTESGQRVIKSTPLLSLNYPREYQWGSYRTYEIPVFMDLTPYLKPGPNSICISVATRKLPARLNATGAILTFAGESLPIDTDNTWKCSATASYGDAPDWTREHFDDQPWASALETAAPPGDSICLLDPAMYQRPFVPLRMRAPMAGPQSDVWFETDWNLASAPRDAWLRLLSNRPYDLFINGSRVNTEHRGAAALDSGDWIIGTQRPTDAHSPSELLDPDEVGALDVDNRFVAPPHTDPTLSDLHRSSDQFTRDQYSADHPDGKDAQSYALAPGGLDDNAKATPGHTRILGFYAPTERTPTPLKVDRRLEEFNAYAIGGLLKRGHNRIRIRLLPSPEAMPLDWAPQVAMDASATLADRTGADLQTGPGWSTSFRGANGDPIETAGALSGSPARTIGVTLCRRSVFTVSFTIRAPRWRQC